MASSNSDQLEVLRAGVSAVLALIATAILWGKLHHPTLMIGSMAFVAFFFIIYAIVIWISLKAFEE